MKVLVVTQAFGDHAVGEMISEPADISAVREAGHSHFCRATKVRTDFFHDDGPATPPADA